MSRAEWGIHSVDQSYAFNNWTSPLVNATTITVATATSE